jgi:hypothetical protein
MGILLRQMETTVLQHGGKTLGRHSKGQWFIADVR